MGHGDTKSLAGHMYMLRQLINRVPRPLRFLAIGGLGLLTDVSIFTALVAYGGHPLLLRLVSLAAATLVTWRLNRALTFDRSGRHQADEALRYACVTLTAQGTSYAIFAVLILTVLGWLPQLALLIGAAVAAVISYNGHRLFAFAPRKMTAMAPALVEGRGPMRRPTA
jgi:putative flippase GtrA